MCGRFNILSNAQAFIDILNILTDIDEAVENKPRYNIAPSSNIIAILHNKDAANAKLTMLKWGLVPFWSKDPAIGNRMINARSETVASKPAFRHSFSKQRCLIAANGWYEWRSVAGKKQPYFIYKENNAPLFFAGLWATWSGLDKAGNDTCIESCTILTTDASDAIKDIHPRMPVILDAASYSPWIDPELTDKEKVKSIVQQKELNRFKAHPVSTYVNSPANDSPACIDPVDI